MYKISQDLCQNLQFFIILSKMQHRIFFVFIDALLGDICWNLQENEDEIGRFSKILRFSIKNIRVIDEFNLICVKISLKN